MHVRQQVREAVGAVLSTGSWNHVFESRIPPQRDVLPYLLVYVESESSENLTIHPQVIQSRQMILSVRGNDRIADNEYVEDAVDALAEEIEQALTHNALNAALGGQLKSIELTNTFIDNVEDDDERQYFSIGLDYLVTVHTLEGQPETLI